MEEDSFYIGVAIFVIRDNKILLEKRKGGYGDGSWGTPGGHLEYGEKIKDAASRELFEETGMICNSFDFLNIVHDPDFSNGRHYVHISFLAKEVQGEPILKEPEECYEWQWFDLNNLPKNTIICSKLQIEAFLEKKNFVDSK